MHTTQLLRHLSRRLRHKNVLRSCIPCRSVRLDLRHCTDQNVDFNALPDTTSHCQQRVSTAFITTSPQNSKRQDASDHRSPSKLACLCWCVPTSTSSACLPTPNLVRYDTCRHNCTAEREDWQSASVVNYTVVTDPTIRQPGFDLPRQSWSLLHRFRTGQGPCQAIPHKRGLAKSPICDCGLQQTTSHIVDACPLTKLNGGLQLLHEAEDDAVKWLESIATTAFTKWNEITNSRLLLTTLCLTNWLL